MFYKKAIANVKVSRDSSTWRPLEEIYDESTQET